MRKYFIGIFIGFCLSFAAGAHAEVINMIGKVVQGTVDLTINNKKMEYQAILIDGTTYAPVRMLGEETGYIVKYDSVEGVKLVKKIVGSRESVQRSIDAVQLAISTNEKMISSNEEQLVKLQQEEQNNEIVTRIKNTESELERLRKSNLNLKNQLAQLNQTLVEIAEQEAELNAPDQPEQPPTQP